MKKKFTLLTVALALALGAGIGAVAASNNETISALLNRDISVVYNGVKQSFADANGKTVYPISYNGSTYLPVRAVSGLLDLPIAYDAPTDTITMGTAERQPTNVVSLKNSGANKFSWIINDKSELSIVGSDATQTYTNGIHWDIWNSGLSTQDDRVLYFDASGYSEVSFTAWSDIEAIVKLYDQNYNVITSFTLSANALTAKTITLPAGTTKLAFGADGPAGSKGTLKILDAVVK